LEYSFNLTPYLTSEQSLNVLKFEVFEFIKNKWMKYEGLENIIIENVMYPILKVNYSKDYLNDSVPVFISVSNGKITKFQEFIIGITDNYPPILKKPLPKKVFDEDQEEIAAFDLYNYFSDIENQTLQFLGFGNNISLNIDDNGLVDISIEHDWFGTQLLIIRAIDFELGFTETSFTIKVNPINDPPVIEQIPHFNITTGLNSIEFAKYVIDVDNDFEDLIITIDSDYATLAGNFIILNYPADMEGEQEITLTVSDGELTDVETIFVNIISSDDIVDSSGIQITPLIFWGVMVFLIALMCILIITSVIYINRVRNFIFNEIFLIYRDGLLIAHATRGDKTSSDSDIISSMFTAIQDFIQESFTNSTHDVKKSPLKRLDFGEFQIVIDRGEHIYIAAVFKGFALRNMLVKIGKIRKQIEEKYSDILPTWGGDMTQLKGAQKIIEELLYSTGPDEALSKKEQMKSNSQSNNSSDEKSNS
jgi:hypothetical protein